MRKINSAIFGPIAIHKNNKMCRRPRYHYRSDAPSKLGGSPAGVTCFVEDGILCREHNLFEIQRTKIRVRLEPPPGKVKIEIAKNHPDFRTKRLAQRDHEGERRARCRRHGTCHLPHRILRQ